MGKKFVFFRALVSFWSTQPIKANFDGSKYTLSEHYHCDGCNLLLPVEPQQLEESVPGHTDCSSSLWLPNALITVLIMQCFSNCGADSMGGGAESHCSWGVNVQGKIWSKTRVKWMRFMKGKKKNVLMLCFPKLYNNKKKISQGSMPEKVVEPQCFLLLLFKSSYFS